MNIWVNRIINKISIKEYPFTEASFTSDTQKFSILPTLSDATCYTVPRGHPQIDPIKDRLFSHLYYFPFLTSLLCKLRGCGGHHLEEAPTCNLSLSPTSTFNDTTQWELWSYWDFSSYWGMETWLIWVLTKCGSCPSLEGHVRVYYTIGVITHLHYFFYFSGFPSRNFPWEIIFFSLCSII